MTQLEVIKKAIAAFVEDLPSGDVVDCDTEAMAEFIATCLAGATPCDHTGPGTPCDWNVCRLGGTAGMELNV